MNEPIVSVVVPTEGRFPEIGRLVASLRDARRNHDVELIIVDSSEPPLEPELIPAWDTGWMSIVRGTPNVRQKRNLGSASARGAWIAFTDSDCIVLPGYFDALFAAIRRPEAHAYAGRIEFRGEENRVWYAIKESQLVTPETQTGGVGDTAWCATANLIVLRSLFEELGGFDESLPFRLGGDDVDFGLRLRRLGKPLRILPDVIVVHPTEPWSHVGAILSKAWRWGRVEYHLALRHPEAWRSMPPFFVAATLTFALACLAAAVRNLALLWMLPLWILTFTVLAARFGDDPFLPRYLGAWLDRVYHLGAVYEHIRRGSLRFLWQGLILEEQIEQLFPDEPQQQWAMIGATMIVGLIGLLVAL